jgi:F-type H+-transporting ATPase subunit b
MELLAISLLRVQEEVQPVGGLFDIETGLSLWTLVIFLVLLWVLYKFAYPHILGAVEAREQRIQQLLDEAMKDRDEAARVLEEHRKLLAEGRQHAQELVNEGKQAAERLREEALQGARQEQEEMLERARQEIERERELAVIRLREEAVELSLAAASKLVRHRLQGDAERSYVRDYLQSVQVGGDGARAGA